MKNLIGRKVRGFKFETGKVNYNRQMDRVIGEIGEIAEENIYGYRVIFLKCGSWTYPADQIKEHLVDEAPTLEEVKERTLTNDCGIYLRADIELLKETIEKLTEKLESIKKLL